MEPEDQAELEEHYHRQLRDGATCRLAPFPSDFAPDTAAKIRSGYSMLEEWFQPVSHRGALHRAMLMVKQGIEPPAEMLLVMRDCYMEYLNAGGAISLERAMLGRPKQKVGTVAEQVARGKRTVNRDYRFRVEFDTARMEGMNDAQAAAHAQEVVTSVFGWSPDADSWLRQYRRAVPKNRRRVRRVDK